MNDIELLVSKPIMVPGYPTEEIVKQQQLRLEKQSSTMQLKKLISSMMIDELEYWIQYCWNSYPKCNDSTLSIWDNQTLVLSIVLAFGQNEYRKRTGKYFRIDTTWRNLRYENYFKLKIREQSISQLYKEKHENNSLD